MKLILHYAIGLLFNFSILLSQIRLDVNTIPKKVDIYLDGMKLGSSPIRDERISPGVHKFEITKKGYAPLSYDLLVNPAQAIELDFFLNPIYDCKFKTEEKGFYKGCFLNAKGFGGNNASAFILSPEETRIKIQSLFSNMSSLSFLELIEMRKNYKKLNYSLTEIELQLLKLVF